MEEGEGNRKKWKGIGRKKGKGMGRNFGWGLRKEEEGKKEGRR